MARFTIYSLFAVIWFIHPEFDPIYSTDESFYSNTRRAKHFYPVIRLTVDSPDGVVPRCYSTFHLPLARAYVSVYLYTAVTYLIHIYTKVGRTLYETRFSNFLFKLQTTEKKLKAIGKFVRSVNYRRRVYSIETSRFCRFTDNNQFRRFSFET